MRHSEYQGERFVGMDLGDRLSQISILDRSTGEIDESRVTTSRRGVSKFFSEQPPSLVAIEVGTHSFWVSQMLESLGHTVVIANPREVMLISKSTRKNDRRDAELLMRLVAADPELLRPIKHRGLQAQLDLTLIKARSGLVDARVKLVNQIRGLVKPFGLRLSKTSSTTLHAEAKKVLPEELWTALSPLLTTVQSMSVEIKSLEKKLDQIANDRYPIAVHLQQVPGIGPISAMTFVLMIDDPHRFSRSRSVGAYVGLVPRQHESGDKSPQLGITKTGNSYLRKLLVNCAQRTLGVFGVDSDIRQWGLLRAQRGGGNAKKRAVIAVARKLAIVMHRMWITGEGYREFRATGTECDVKKTA